MEIIFVINGTLQRGIDNELNPPKVAKEFGPDTFNIDYNWSIETKPNVILKSAREVEMTTVKELESIRGWIGFTDYLILYTNWNRNFNSVDDVLLKFHSTLNLEMGVLTFPEDNLTQRYQGTSFVAMWIRDSDHVIQRVLDLIPRLGFDIFVEVKYLDRVLTFTGM